MTLRDTYSTFRISTDEITSQKKVITLIDNDVRIPGLKNYIQEYKEIAGHTDNKEVATSPEAKSESTNMPTSSLTATAIAPTPAPSVSKPSSVPIQKEYVFFEDLD